MKTGTYLIYSPRVQPPTKSMLCKVLAIHSCKNDPQKCKGCTQKEWEGGYFAKLKQLDTTLVEESFRNPFLKHPGEVWPCLEYLKKHSKKISKKEALLRLL